MSCQGCCGFDDTFNARLAKKELKQYLKSGPSKTTRKLLEKLEKTSIAGKSLMDIGGGIGAIQFELFKKGLKSAASVDASPAYLESSKKAAQNLSLEDKITYEQGDFVDIASSLNHADITTLDKVICCYENYEDLVKLSVQKTNQVYGIILPRDVWWVRSVNAIGNWFRNITRSKFKSYVHSMSAIEDIIFQNGFQRLYEENHLQWTISVYGKTPHH